ncbi:hypothetical protein TNCV_275371 [Trichonephila clavipes]|nr:hypothetical protein TNCV_275371 [Trichonephila clavipes]
MTDSSYDNRKDEGGVLFSSSLKRFKPSHSRFIVSDVEEQPLVTKSLTMESGFSKFFRSSVRDAEINLRAGQRIISEIKNSQGSSQIPKSNPQLLHAEINGLS